MKQYRIDELKEFFGRREPCHFDPCITELIEDVELLTADRDDWKQLAGTNKAANDVLRVENESLREMLKERA